MIGLLICLIVILWAALFRFRRRRLYKLASLIPSPKNEIPVIGVTHTFIGNSQVMINPADTEVILKTCLEKDDLHKFIREIIGYGGIFAPVSIWRRRRKILVPVFKPKNIEQFVGVFSEQCKKLSYNLEAKLGTGTFSIWPLISSYTMDSVCETAMGINIDAQNNPNTPFLVSMNRILNIVCERIFHVWLHPGWIFMMFPQYQMHEHCRKVLHDFTDTVIKKKREEIRKQNEENSHLKPEECFEQCEKKSFLDLMIALSGDVKGFTDVELREEILTLMVAGTDTSAVAIGNTLKLLAKYPDTQEKVYREIFEVFGESDRAIVKDDLKQMKYLEMVLKESLRLFPPVPIIVRKVEKELKLPSGTIVPAGCGVAVSIWGAHRDPKYWGPNAEHFEPERFLPERFSSIPPCSYMPFSNGPRNCLGYQYAMMSMKVSLTAILRKYKVVGDEESGPIPHIPVKFEIMMKAVDGYQIKLEKRKNTSN